MAFLRDCFVVAVRTQSHTFCMLLRCAQACLALTQKPSTGEWVHG